MVEIRFHPEAQGDYQDALAWYQARSPQAATRFEAELERVLEAVAANPDMFPAYNDEHHFAMLTRFPYSLVYLSQPGQVEIVAVAHPDKRCQEPLLRL